jgi:predicted O-methyltransferase YrrM
MEINNFIGPKYITEVEGQILYELVMKHKPKKLLEIGNHAGFSTICLARAVRDLDEYNMMVSFDEPSDSYIRRNLKENLIVNVDLIIDYSYKVLAEKIQESDFIFIDKYHENIDELWSFIKENIRKNVILVFHDVLCEQSDSMKVPDFVRELSRDIENIAFTEYIETYDDANNLNGFSVHVFDYERSKTEERVELINISEPTEIKIEVVERKKLLTKKKRIETKTEEEIKQNDNYIEETNIIETNLKEN